MLSDTGLSVADKNDTPRVGRYSRRHVAVMPPYNYQTRAKDTLILCQSHGHAQHTFDMLQADDRPPHFDGMPRHSLCPYTHATPQPPMFTMLIISNILRAELAARLSPS